MGGKRGLPSISTVRTVWLVVVLAIAFELVLIPVFGFTQLRGIRDKADEARTHYATDYTVSHIRDFLINDFWNTAKS